MNNAWAYAAQIRQRYPALSIETIRVNQEGQNNDVLVVNERLIFRFARYPAAAETLGREVAVLEAVRPYLTLPVPEPRYQNLAAEAGGGAFMGYPMVPGSPLWPPDFQAMSRVSRRQVARQLALFLRELHGVPLASVKTALPQDDTPESYAGLYSRIRSRLFPHMRPDARQAVARHFESFLEAPAAYRFEPRLRHGDFGTGNILVDPDSVRATGVIDFGSAGAGDPATDFAGLLAGFGEEFFYACAESYPEMTEALPRVRFYVGTFALEEALFGIEHGDAEAFSSGIAEYR